MIVNPQLFNYRLIISALLVVVTVLGVYSYTNYKSVKSYEEFLKQEKLLLEKELTDMLINYNELSRDYNLVSSQLHQAKLEANTALDSLKSLEKKLSVISKFKTQLLALKTKGKLLLVTIDSLNSVNLKLRQEKRNAIKTTNNTVTINSLEATNIVLNKTIDKPAILKAHSITATPLRISNSNKKTTTKAKRVNAMDICVNLTENPLITKGEKEIYIQIVSPDNNIIADKGEVFFNSTSLIYSKKEIINFNHKALNICSTVITYSEDRPLKKGIHYINVFHENRKLGSTRILLN